MALPDDEVSAIQISATGIGSRTRTILGILENADEPLEPKEIAEMLNAEGTEMSEGEVRETLSQMAKDGHVRNLDRGKYIHPAKANEPDNADTLT